MVGIGSVRNYLGNSCMHFIVRLISLSWAVVLFFILFCEKKGQSSLLQKSVQTGKSRHHRERRNDHFYDYILYSRVMSATNEPLELHFLCVKWPAVVTIETFAKGLSVDVLVGSFCTQRDFTRIRRLDSNGGFKASKFMTTEAHCILYCKIILYRVSYLFTRGTNSIRYNVIFTRNRKKTIVIVPTMVCILSWERNPFEKSINSEVFQPTIISFEIG